jgi:hypothetical protein
MFVGSKAKTFYKYIISNFKCPNSAGTGNGLSQKRLREALGSTRTKTQATVTLKAHLKVNRRYF